MVRKYQPMGGKYGDGSKAQQQRGQEESSKGSSQGGSRRGHGGGHAGHGGGGDRHLNPDGRGGGGRSRSRNSSPRGVKGGGRAKTPMDAGAIKSRREISLVTMNLSGSSLMGLTPKYKVNLIQEFLGSFPEAVFIQDSIERDDLTRVLENISEGKYEYFFQGVDDADEEDTSGGDSGNGSGDRRRRRSRSRERRSQSRDQERGRRSRSRSRSRDRRSSPRGRRTPRRGSRDEFYDEDKGGGRGARGGGGGGGGDAKVRCLTGIAWNRDKYFGSPLQLGDERLSEWTKWLRERDLTVVRLDSRERIGVEDVYPSLIAISWHGRDYTTTLRKRNRDCEDFLEFLCTLRENNWNVPIVVGGDFNMDMKSFDMKAYPGFALVPYRPISGTLAKDLRNTFMYTMDSLQVTETGFKQHHPETFPNPFITVKVRGRHQIRIWAVVRIQRAVRRWLQINHERRRARLRQWEDKRRWKKKLGDSDYRSDEEEDYRRHRGKDPDADDDKRRSNRKFDRTPRKDRKYALYWDERDDPRYKQDMSKEEYEHRRRKDFNEGSRSVMDGMDRQLTISDGGGHRRKRFNDLKSIYDRKREEEEIQQNWNFH